MAKKFTVDRASFFQMGMEELRKQAKRVFETANRRMRNIRFYSENRGAVSPAYIRAMETGGLFSKRGKNQRELIRELNRAYAFLNSDDGSTVRSAMEYGKLIRDMTPNLTDGERSILYAAYREIEKKYPAYIGQKNSKGNWVNSDKLMAMVDRVIRDARSSIYGGLAGDLLSPDRRTINETLSERAAAIAEVTNQVSSEIESWVNSQLNGATMNANQRTFKMRLSDVVPDMRNPSITVNTRTKNGSGGGNGVIKAPK